MRLKTNNFVMYLFNLLTKGLNEIIFTQNISFLFKHQQLLNYSFHHHLELN